MAQEKSRGVGCNAVDQIHPPGPDRGNLQEAYQPSGPMECLGNHTNEPS